MNSFAPLRQFPVLRTAPLPAAAPPETVALRYTAEDDRVWIGVPRPAFVEGATAVLEGTLIVVGVVVAAKILEALLAPPRRIAA